MLVLAIEPHDPKVRDTDARADGFAVIADPRLESPLVFQPGDVIAAICLVRQAGQKSRIGCGALPVVRLLRNVNLSPEMYRETQRMLLDRAVREKGAAAR